MRNGGPGWEWFPQKETNQRRRGVAQEWMTGVAMQNGQRTEHQKYPKAKADRKKEVTREGDTDRPFGKILTTSGKRGSATCSKRSRKALPRPSFGKPTPR